MYYKVLKIVKVSDKYYDIDFKEVCWFSKGKVFRGVRVEYREILSQVVATGVSLYNMTSVIAAYDCPIDFSIREEPLPTVEGGILLGKAIY